MAIKPSRKSPTGSNTRKTRSSTLKAAQNKTKRLRNRFPGIKSKQDLDIGEGYDTLGIPVQCEWHYYCPTGETYMGISTTKEIEELTLDEMIAGLKRLKDADIYPRVPPKMKLTIAPDTLDPSSVHIKRSGLKLYPRHNDTGAAHQVLLAETLSMEALSKRPHPYIIHYHGCRIRRGRITHLVLEKLNHSLMEYAFDDLTRPKFLQINKDAFLAGVQSAVSYLHSLGRAHNDVNPYNIMVRDDGSPVLIGFDSCRPLGEYALSAGTTGFADEEDEDWLMSLRRHDEFGMMRLGQWWDEAVKTKDWRERWD